MTTVNGKKYITSNNERYYTAYIYYIIYYRLLSSSLSLFMSLDHGQPQVTETKGGLKTVATVMDKGLQVKYGWVASACS